MAKSPESIPAEKLSPPRTEDATRNLFYGVQLIGIRFPQKHRRLFLLWSIFLNVSVTLYLPFGFLLSWVVDIRGFGPSEFLTSLQVGINAFSCSSKVLIVAVMQYRFREAVKFMRTLDSRCSQPEEHELIRKCVHFGNSIFNFYTFMYITYSTSTFITQYIMGTPPYSLYNPLLNWRNSVWEFRIQSYIEYFLMNAICFQDVVVDVYSVIYINIIRTHIKILARRIRQLGNNFEGLSPDQRLEQLVQCILDHKTIMELFNSISYVISGTIFVQFVLGGLVIGSAIINVMIFAEVYAAIATSCFLSAVMMETFPICYFGNCLMRDSEDLSNAVFESNWLGEELRYKKMLIFFMHHVQKPPVFMAMKIFPITVDSNLQVVKFAFSIYTLIQQMELGKHYKT